MQDEVDTLWIKVYDGEGDDAELIFEGTTRQWEIYRKTRGWDVSMEPLTPSSI